MNLHKPFDPTDRILRQFAAMWIVFFGAIAAWQNFHYNRFGVAVALAILALTVGPLGLAWPRGIRPVFVGWMTLAAPIGWVVSHIVLAAIFYGVFTPVALFFRFIRRDALGLRSQSGAKTYWRARIAAKDNVQYLRQY
jgi:hypothetical protein